MLHLIYGLPVIKVTHPCFIPYIKLSPHFIYLFQQDVPPKPDENPHLRGVALRDTAQRWPSGIVPYVIIPGYGSVQEAFIIATMQKMERLIAINNVACIQFRPKVAGDVYYISIVNGYGCSSYVGRNTGITLNRTVTLQYPGCIDEGRIMHELLHVLGFHHEQSRPDRDSYVRVNYSNIISGLEYNFEKYSNTVVNTLNTSYDYASVMHYPSDAFSVNGFATIVPLQSGVTVGQRTTGTILSPATTPTTVASGLMRVNLIRLNTASSISFTAVASGSPRFSLGMIYLLAGAVFRYLLS
ncbi:hypothetical protein I4U23_019935 [Adineta vaga]|nr:hypothetical protein I4U23_019935 [Adineta vaga]